MPSALPSVSPRLLSFARSQHPAGPHRSPGPAGLRKVALRQCPCGTAQGNQRLEMWANAQQDFVAYPQGSSIEAFHEAGHTAAGLAFGCRLDQVRIAGDYVTRWTETPDLPSAWRCALSLAGWMAEAIYLDDPSPDDSHWYRAIRRAKDGEPGFCDECKVARSIVASNPELDGAAVMIITRRLTGATRRFLLQRWSSVERIAHALLAVGVLDHDDCVWLMDEDARLQPTRSSDTPHPFGSFPGQGLSGSTQRGISLVTG